MYDKLLPLKDAIVDGLSGPAQRFHERQFDFFKKITSVSGKIKDFPKGPQRKNACYKALQVRNLSSSFISLARMYSPLTLSCQIVPAFPGY